MAPHSHPATGDAPALRTPDDSPGDDSVLELYHQASKLARSDVGTFMRIGMINQDPGIRGIISRPFPGFARARRVPLLPRVRREREFLEVVDGRRSVRAFTGRPMGFEALSNVLQIGNGVTGRLDAPDGTRWPLRTTPSPGGLFPTRIFCAALAVDALPAGLYCYDVAGGTLDLVAERGDLREELSRITAMDQAVGGAACCLVLTCHTGRLHFKYGERSYRFVLLEAGHIAQNLLLAAEYEGLGAVVLGGFIDDEVQALCGLSAPEEFAMYLVLLGATG